MTAAGPVGFVAAVEDFLAAMKAAKPSRHTIAAYRRDLLGIARRIATQQGVDLDGLTVGSLDKAALRHGFASWAAPGSDDGGLCVIIGPPGERRLTVVGKGDKTRALPLYPALEAVLDRYLASRSTRFPTHDLTRPTTPLLVHHTGTRITPRQVQYLIERLYVRAGIRTQAPPGASSGALRRLRRSVSPRQASNSVQLHSGWRPGGR